MSDSTTSTRSSIAPISTVWFALVDTLCAEANWPLLLELRNRSRAAVITGRQLWPAATLAEYRLALWAPAEWATQVLDEDSGRFTIGPLTEVVAQNHRFE